MEAGTKVRPWGALLARFFSVASAALFCHTGAGTACLEGAQASYRLVVKENSQQTCLQTSLAESFPQMRFPLS